MNLQGFFVSKRGTGLAMWLGRNMPRRVAMVLVELGVRLVTRNPQSGLMQAIRTNQAVVRGLPPDAPELGEVVKMVIRNAGRGYFELYHRVGQGREAVAAAVTFAPELMAAIRDYQTHGRGTLIVGPHVGNFDLGLLAFSTTGIPVQVISFAIPPGGYELQNRMRADAGYVMTPASAGAAKMALQRLRSGGVVATGIDRPPASESEGEWVNFFGRPTRLYTGYTRLAMSTGACLVMCHAEPSGNGNYRFGITQPIEMIRTGDRKKDTVVNTERVLAHAEEIIRARPAEWMLFHPLWPQPLETIPAPGGGAGPRSVTGSPAPW